MQSLTNSNKRVIIKYRLAHTKFNKMDTRGDPVMAKEVTTFRLSAGFKPKLEKLAKAENRTVSTLIGIAVQEFLERQSKKHVQVKDKPTCADFIVAAIREIRCRSANLKPGTCAGVAMYKVYGIASEVYTDEEFREGLKTLMESDSVIVIGRGYDEKLNGEGKVSQKDCFRDRRIFVFVSNFPLGLCLDGEGHPVDPELDWQQRILRRILLYVRVDGLPQKVQNLLFSMRGGKRITAQKVIESM